MANQEHLDILKQGVEIWNQWREQHPEVQPDLQKADLSDKGFLEANLRGADLSGAILSNAELIRADLSQANLRGANLRGVDFSNANLSAAQFEETDLNFAWLGGAILRRTDLSKIELSYAHLEHADLSETILREAHLDKANLSEAHLYKADLRGADLSGADLSGANLSRAILRGADLQEADLSGAQLSEADLSETRLTRVNLIEADLSLAKLQQAYLYRADLSRSVLRGADLREAKLEAATLYEVDLRGADLRGADLSRATLVATDLTETDLTNCRVYGISVWDVYLEATKQDNLIITPTRTTLSLEQVFDILTNQDNQPTITVDNLKIAQFIYLLLNNAEIRDVIDTIAKKAVLILGRFTPERKTVLDTLREALRTHGYLPILFDFDKPSSRSFTETVRTLAHLSRFIIADLTDPSSIPQELQAIIPTLAVPVQPILLEGKREYSMFVDFLKTYHWVLPIHYYTDQANLLTTLEEYVIVPAEQKAHELEKR